MQNTIVYYLIPTILEQPMKEEEAFRFPGLVQFLPNIEMGDRTQWALIYQVDSVVVSGSVTTATRKVYIFKKEAHARYSPGIMLREDGVSFVTMQSKALTIQQ